MPKPNPYAAEIYRDWFNNWLTLAKFAEHYGISEEAANKLISEGREAHNAKADPLSPFVVVS